MHKPIFKTLKGLEPLGLRVSEVTVEGSLVDRWSTDYTAASSRWMMMQEDESLVSTEMTFFRITGTDLKVWDPKRTEENGCIMDIKSQIYFTYIF